MQAPDKKNIEKVISGASNKEDAREVANWLSSSVEGQQYLSDLLDKDAYLFEEELNESFSPHVYQSERMLRNINKGIARTKMLRVSLRVAAVFLPLLILLGIGFYANQQVDLFGETHYSELYVPKGEKAKIFFQDGTEVFLNADTKIRYPQKFGLRKRNVYLEGEAYFNVASNKRRPFIVHTGDAYVKVLGTSFNVNAYKDNKEVRVVLDEGEIVFASRGNEYKIDPGQKFTYDIVNRQMFVTNLAHSQDESLWKSNQIRLNDTPLAETLNILNRTFDVSFTIADKKSLGYSFNLLTESKSLNFILNELEKIAPIKFAEKNDTISVKAL